MAINKVVFGNQTLMDTTEATVTPETMVRGTKALGATGEMLTGTLDTAPLYNGLDQENSGYALDARQGKVLNDKKLENNFNQLTQLSGEPTTGDILAVNRNGTSYKMDVEILRPSPLVMSIPVSMWSGEGPYTITVTSSNMTEQSVLIPHYDADSAQYFVTAPYIIPGNGSFQICVEQKPTNTVTMLIQFIGSLGTIENIQLPDVYKKSEVDNFISNINNKIGSTDITNIGASLSTAINNLNENKAEKAPFLLVTIPVGQWSGNDGDYYIEVSASNVTTNSILVPTFDEDSSTLFTGTKLWCEPDSGSFTIHVDYKPTDTVNILIQFMGVIGEAQYQVLADVYSKSQVDSIVAQSTASRMQHGTVTNTVASGAQCDGSVTFPNAFGSVPTVVANILGSFSPKNDVTHVVIKSVTTTGFTYRFTNLYSGQLSIPFGWIAIA